MFGDIRAPTVDLTVYFCIAETKELCLIDQARLVVPIIVAPSGVDEIVAPYSIPAP